MSSPDRWNTDVEFYPLPPETPAVVQRVLRHQSEAGRLGEAYLEFGVFQGRSLIAAAEALRQLGEEQARIVAFDSFQGIPELGAHDARLPLAAGMYCCSRRDVEMRLAEHGVDCSRIEFVEGYFETSLTDEVRTVLGIARAGVIMFDCDLYESTKAALTFARPLIDVGAVLIFDDWNFSGKSPDRGQRRAFREFAEQSHLGFEEWFSYSWHGQVFSVANRA